MILINISKTNFRAELCLAIVVRRVAMPICGAVNRAAEYGVQEAGDVCADRLSCDALDPDDKFIAGQTVFCDRQGFRSLAQRSDAMTSGARLAQ
jgi:hypothetical protein